MGQLDWYLRGDLKPRHLQLMVALDEVRNIGKAAARANVTQPAISKALGDLERGLGVKLFERSARGVQPTVYGECLIRHARIMLDQLASTRDELRGLVTGATGRVAVGALSSTVNTLLPQSLALLRMWDKRQRGYRAMGTGSVPMVLPSNDEVSRGDLHILPSDH